MSNISPLNFIFKLCYHNHLHHRAIIHHHFVFLSKHHKQKCNRDWIKEKLRGFKRSREDKSNKESKAKWNQAQIHIHLINLKLARKQEKLSESSLRSSENFYTLQKTHCNLEIPDSDMLSFCYFFVFSPLIWLSACM